MIIMSNLNQNIQQKRRLLTIDVMQGIAMLWVVVGHHLLAFMPPVYGSIHYYIYSFHMPFFIFISSFLIAYSYKLQAYSAYIYRKFHKFFIPYVLIGILVTLLSAMQKGGSTIPKNLLDLLVSPKQSDATFLWYIYLLFFLYVLYPLCFKARKKLRGYFELLMVLVSVYFYVNPVPTPILCLDYLTGYLLFYTLGIVSVWHFSLLEKRLLLLKALGIFSLVIFIVLTVFAFVSPRRFIYIGLCFASIPAMYGLSVILGKIRLAKDVLVSISKNCFHIYLVHMFFIQGIAMVFVKLYAHRIESLGLMFAYLIVSTSISIVGSIAVFKVYDKLKLIYRN